METFGSRVKALRTAKGLSLRALAREAGFSTTFMADIEAERHRWPRPEKLERLAAALGVPVFDLAVLHPQMPGVSEALRLALAGDRDGLMDLLGGLDGGYLERLEAAAGVLRDAAGEVLGRRH